MYEKGTLVVPNLFLAWVWALCLTCNHLKILWSFLCGFPCRIFASVPALEYAKMIV